MSEQKDEFAPVQKQEPRPVPFWITELAYRDYVKQYGRAQTLERLNERGGFGQGELINHLANIARELAGQVEELEQVRQQRDRFKTELENRVIRSVAKSHLWVCLICDQKDESWREIDHGPDCVFATS